MRQSVSAAILISLGAAITAVPTRAQEAPAVAPSHQRPMLEELNRETEALYKEVGTSLVRVQLPQPRWMKDYAMAPMKDRLDKLDPTVRRRLEQDLSAGPNGEPALTAVLHPTTTPSTQPVALIVTTQPTYAVNDAPLLLVPAQIAMADRDLKAIDAVLGARLQMDFNNNPAPFSPNNIGLLLDDEGHILVPLYVERETVEANPVRLASADGKVIDAKFVGSDRQTNLTLLQIEKPAGRPIPLSMRKPVDGSLVLYVSTLDGSGRLGLWNGGQQECGIVFTTDGGVAGIARYGQFLGGSACHLIAEQLIHFGSVRRATLGVIVREIRADDPVRRQMPALGIKTAMRIDEVMPHSAADKAGLKPGDVLLALAGEAVSDIPSLAVAIASRSGKTELQVLRGNEVLKVNVDLEQQK